ncbi:MAG: tRNA 2-thiouridine(34) synthase MnmA [Solitalea-like symbiont of Acarus siro]
MSKKGKVLVAMSGGIDSSIAAVLLKDMGYEVIGATVKTWDYERSGISNKGTCCSIQDINDAKLLAIKFGLKHYVIDLRSDFENTVIDNFTNEYLKGRTPNPCIVCNNKIKWGSLIDLADKINCEFIATGHYAKIRYNQERYVISKGNDDSKDQSYVLWGLKQNELKRTLFPLGNYFKKEIKQIANDLHLTKLANKKESFEICFIPNNNYRTFLQHKTNTTIEQGKFISEDNKVIGTHQGYPFYTIGQRKGLNIAVGEARYVKAINPLENTIVLSSKDSLKTMEATATNINLIKYNKLDSAINAITKIRYRDTGTQSVIKQNDDNIHINFKNYVYAVAPGQSAVFYEGDDLIGGGIFI